MIWKRNNRSLDGLFPSRSGVTPSKQMLNHCCQFWPEISQVKPIKFR